jgi:DNA replication protein DnaC
VQSYAHIRENLKQLRLSSFSENLDVRIEEAVQTKMSYADFLLILTQDEIDRRKQKRQHNAIKRANLGRYQRITEFDFDFNPQINRSKIMDLHTCSFVGQKQNILFVGPTGVGKTSLAKSIAHQACCKGYSVLFTRTMKMLEHIYSGKADNSFEKKLKGYIKPDLLILDDWGLQPFPNQLLDILNEIICERYEQGSMIVTSNRPMEDWSELFSEPVVSSALLDRLLHNTHRIIIEGKSYRTKI